MKPNFHNKNFALRLALMRRQTWTRKWRIRQAKRSNLKPALSQPGRESVQAGYHGIIIHCLPARVGLFFLSFFCTCKLEANVFTILIIGTAINFDDKNRLG